MAGVVEVCGSYCFEGLSSWPLSWPVVYTFHVHPFEESLCAVLSWFKFENQGVQCLSSN